ncbi:hypothetical protein EFP02_12210, partial [Lactiplantibacillus plantarum]|nr:hypothetical protein [Lactiplantibacillus plantarum]
SSYRLGVVIGMPRFVFPQIIPEFLVFRQSLVKSLITQTQVTQVSDAITAYKAAQASSTVDNNSVQ